MSARAFGQGAEGEDHRGPHDARESPRLEREPPRPLQADAVEQPRRPPEASGPHVERAAHADHDPCGRDVVHVLGDPPLLLRGAETDEDDGRCGALEAADDLVVTRIGARAAVVIDRDTGAGEVDAHRRYAAPPLGGGTLGDGSRAADERDRKVAIGSESNHERTDLHTGPPANPPSREERFHKRDACPIWEREVGGVQQFQIGRIVASTKQDLRVRREDASRSVPLEESDACAFELLARCDLVEPDAEDLACHYGPGVPASARASDA